ncbi:MAG: orotidine-5'-phosphate decarboxylase [Propionibacteriaceae bacterium]|jgi:orotidine-5'-phosphate decarboxylase|nr:orotidine-5'-phosphate decarboxylase [Propionibacteriaceae bacterium]
MTFHDRLLARASSLGSICVGIDPHPGVMDAWGVSYDLAGLERVAMGTVEALGDHVTAFKPQSAFFEQWGSAGIAVLERCITEIRSGGGLVILDVKRGDIGSTMEAYAQAYLGEGPLSVDAITISPYLGFGSLTPAFDLAEANDRGVYVLARTSNPEGGDIQLGSTSLGTPVAQSIVDNATQRNHSTGLDAIGLVVGGTHETLRIDLSWYSGSILVPGIGVQGGTISGLASSFAETSALLVPSVSREVLNAGPNPQALQEAVERVLAS